MILRDRDNTSGFTAQGDGTLEERRFYCQNWRSDVVSVMEDDGDPVEWIRYSAYGEATSYPVADVNRDGVVNITDFNEWTTWYGAGSSGNIAVPIDLNFDGVYPDSIDNDLFTASYNATAGHAGRGKVSAIGNRLGYAGYHFDPATQQYHVRHRVYVPELGRWTRRDPLGYVDGSSVLNYGSLCPIGRCDEQGLDDSCNCRKVHILEDPRTSTPRLKFTPHGCGSAATQEQREIAFDLLLLHTRIKVQDLFCWLGYCSRNCDGCPGLPTCYLLDSFETMPYSFYLIAGPFSVGPNCTVEVEYEWYWAIAQVETGKCGRRPFRPTPPRELPAI